MNSREAGEYWNKNADAWTRLSREGYDIYRDSFNTPAFLDALPPIDGLEGLDIGCGEGHNTRGLARRGARMTAIDISERFIQHAQASPTVDGREITFIVADATVLPFEAARFDFATAFMSLMDIPAPERALAEAYRVLRPGGFLQFSICHPCFDTPHRRNLRDEGGKTYAIEVGDYFVRLGGEIGRWLFASAPPDAKEGLPLFEVPRFTRTLSDWINSCIGAGFRVERMAEPRPSDEVVFRYPDVQDAQVVAYFLHVRLRKPRVGEERSPSRRAS